MQSSAFVARPVPVKEQNTVACKQAIDKEWSRLEAIKCWDLSNVREWQDAKREANQKAEKVHQCRLHCIVVEKNAELAPDDPNRKFKARVVLLGDQVKDQNHDIALFQEINSCPATLDASRLADVLGLSPGMAIQQADAMQAYVQAEFKGTPTWVRIPKDRWPPEWAGMRDPVCPLRLSLYGHPDSGGYWEQHCEEQLQQVGFERYANWRSCFWHEELQSLLIVYVDDFKLVGPAENLPKAWAMIRSKIETTEPTDLALYLGCNHEFHQGPSPLTGQTTTLLVYNMEQFLRECINKYKSLVGLQELVPIPTPFVDETAVPIKPPVDKVPPLRSAELKVGKKNRNRKKPGLKEGLPMGSAPVDLDSPPTKSDQETPGRLRQDAACVLMKLLYAARTARFDLLRAIGALSQMISCWTLDCDKRLHALLCYVQQTLSYRQIAWVNNERSELSFHLYSDSDWGGADKTRKSTSGCFFCARGSDSFVPLAAISKKQKAVSASVAEAETVAASHAMTQIGVPSLEMLRTIQGEDVRVTLHEDNMALVNIIKRGHNSNMRHIDEAHGISVALLIDYCQRLPFDIKYTKTAWQCADIFTKAFPKTHRVKWNRLLDLIGLVDIQRLGQPIPLLLGRVVNETDPAFLRDIVEHVPAVAAKPRLYDPPTPSEVRSGTLQEGDKIRISALDSGELFRLLEQCSFPKNVRSVLTGGYGTCVGATFDGMQARLGKHTKRCEGLIRQINRVVQKHFGGTDFCWGSIQINLNTTSLVHVDRNNVGLSLVILLGDFTGGSFVWLRMIVFRWTPRVSSSLLMGPRNTTVVRLLADVIPLCYSITTLRPNSVRRTGATFSLLVSV
jgi:hypothetical protein